MNREFLHGFRNVAFISGVGLLALGTGPLLVGNLLAAAGLVNIGNGLGLGLLAFVTFVPSVVLIVVGAVVADRRSRKVKQNGAA